MAHELTLEQVADQMSTQMGSNPFARFEIHITLLDSSDGSVVDQSQKVITGTDYSHAVFRDLVSVLIGEKKVVD